MASHTSTPHPAHGCCCCCCAPTGCQLAPAAPRCQQCCVPAVTMAGNGTVKLYLGAPKPYVGPHSSTEDYELRSISCTWQRAQQRLTSCSLPPAADRLMYTACMRCRHRPHRCRCYRRRQHWHLCHGYSLLFHPQLLLAQTATAGMMVWPSRRTTTRKPCTLSHPTCRPRLSS
jgi:hypothetical protein